MAGRPIIRAGVRKLTAMGEGAVLEKLSLGMTTQKLIGPNEIDVCNRSFYKWLDQEPGRRSRYHEAKKEGATALAEETLMIADDENLTPEEVNIARLRIDTRKWIASRQNPEEWGDRTGPEVNIDIGGMYLEAVEALQVPKIVEAKSELIGTDDE
jgi:hypothetical protein